jgi:cyclin B
MPSRAALLEAGSRHNSRKHRFDKPAPVPGSGPPRMGSPKDPQDAFDFDLEVFQFMKQREMDQIADPHYFNRQPTIKPKVRMALIDWMVELHKKLRMHTDTLFIAVYLVDLYLSKAELDKNSLQLLGSATLLIAGKVDEVYAPTIRTLVSHSKKVFTSREMSRLEAEILSTLDFKVNFLHASHFMKRFLRIPEPSSRLSMLAHFLNEVAIMDDLFIGTRPSLLAASVVSLALQLEKGSGKWQSDIESNTGYTIKELEPLANQLLESIQRLNKTNYKAVLRKYGTDELCSVSKIQFPEKILFKTNVE